MSEKDPGEPGRHQGEQEPLEPNTERIEALAGPVGERVVAFSDVESPTTPMTVVITEPFEEVSERTETNVAKAALDCADANSQRIRKGMADPLRRRVPMHLMEVEFDYVNINDSESDADERPVEAVWGGRRYAIDDTLDEVNEAMLAQLIVGFVPPEKTTAPVEVADITRRTEDGSLINHVISQRQLTDGWTLDTVITIERQAQLGMFPSYHSEVWACPPELPVAILFYKDSGKGNAAEITDKLEAQTAEMRRVVANDDEQNPEA